MATAGPMNGTLLRVYFNTTGSTYAVFGLSREASFTLSHSPRETTNQDSGGFASFKEGKRSATITASALHSEDAAVNFWDLYDKVVSNTDRGLVGVRMNTGVTGDTYIEATGYVTELTLSNGGVEDNAVYNFSMQVTGALTKSTNS